MLIFRDRVVDVSWVGSVPYISRTASHGGRLGSTVHDLSVDDLSGLQIVCPTRGPTIPRCCSEIMSHTASQGGRIGYTSYI